MFNKVIGIIIIIGAVLGDKYNEAVEFWKNKNTKGILKIIEGVLHKKTIPKEEISEHLFTEEYWKNENEGLLNGRLIDDNELIQKPFTDVVMLDGGEYTTEGDYERLVKNNRNISKLKAIILDDTRVYKCKKIRNELLNNPEWNIYYDDQNDRNGASIFIRK